MDRRSCSHTRLTWLHICPSTSSDTPRTVVGIHSLASDFLGPWPWWHVSRSCPGHPPLVATQTLRPTLWRRLRRFRRGCKKYRTRASLTESLSRSVFLRLRRMWMATLAHRRVLRSTSRRSSTTALPASDLTSGSSRTPRLHGSPDRNQAWGWAHGSAGPTRE